MGAFFKKVFFHVILLCSSLKSVELDVEELCLLVLGSKAALSVFL